MQARGRWYLSRSKQAVPGILSPPLLPFHSPAACRSLVTRQQCCKGCQGPVLRSIQVRPTTGVQLDACGPCAARFSGACTHCEPNHACCFIAVHCVKAPCHLCWHYLAFTNPPHPSAPCSALGGWGRGKQRQSSLPAVLMQLLSRLQLRGASSPPARCAAERACCPGGHMPCVPAKWPQPPTPGISSALPLLPGYLI